MKGEWRQEERKLGKKDGSIKTKKRGNGNNHNNTTTTTKFSMLALNALLCL